MPIKEITRQDDIYFPLGNICTIRFINNVDMGVKCRLAIKELDFVLETLNEEFEDGIHWVSKFRIPESLSVNVDINKVYKYSFSVVTETNIVTPLIGNWYFLDNPDYTQPVSELEG